MSIRVALHHVTRYSYDRPVTLSPHVVRLRPAPHSRTAILSYSLRVQPERQFLNWQQDPFGNYQARVVFPEPTNELRVEVDLLADLVTINPFDFFLDESAENFPVTYDAVTAQELAPYLRPTAEGARLGGMVEAVRRDVARPGRRMVDVLVDVNQRVQQSLRYDIRMEPGVFAPDETLTRGHGSCRDFAWLLVQLLRRLGLAARFVSGYSIQLRPDVKPIQGPVGVSEDSADLHAWAEVYLPGAGWVGLDATSGLFAGEGHIPLACTAEPSSAAPITGSYAWNRRDEDDQLGETFDFSMRVVRIEDRPRSTKPYSDDQWTAILSCGDRVDEALNAADARLTMGGEPTFVAVDDLDAPEWNIAAVGPTKAKYADELLKRLHHKFAPGGLLHYGQGKWYPGESLPRWAYSCYFRRDGEPLWSDATLFADGEGREGATPERARAFATRLAERLGVDPSMVMAGYEDAWYYLWRERRLPVNVDPFDARLDDEEERARLQRVFDTGLKTAVGYALPLAPVYQGEQRRWVSGRWFLRAGRMYLLPGDSPMGLRLPLDSLPWAAPEDRAGVWPLDPTARRAPLPRARLRPQGPGTAPPMGMAGTPARPPAPETSPPRGTSAADVVRTALCVEPRKGTLHVFMPPVSTIEEYLELVSAIEDTAAEQSLPLRLEGYTPPHDHRLVRLQVTPDPGVIEVNVQPAHSWREVCNNTQTLYEEARQTKLGAEKFMLDGRHTGTGGGNHLVIGGATPNDSPLLRRPDLLRSLSSYWLNHPSLSYLFAGLFIGPTSQAPRVDEARHDALYELEIAHRQLPPVGQDVAPWLVDRLYRNLLTDLTGNTHRAELCIDKLWSPDSATGRQGLLELRAFEMPPDAKMSCAQQLLVRALVATFWKRPYDRPMTRWGTSLIDRWVLPNYLAEDFADVIRDLREAGFALQSEWFTPHFEFRFPLYGRAVVDGVELELRQALEPWHVLGEEPAGGAVARYVDSSVERLQVSARGVTPGRHVVTCNGRRVPLAPTRVREEAVAGVRFRAWQPPSALHPTIGVHAPLVFDVLDAWTGRSLGGCTYHVAHPGGRAHDRLPKNALEAESRRHARFQAFGHTPGPIAVPPDDRDPELPHTLDLRRPPDAVVSPHF